MIGLVKKTDTQPHDLRIKINGRIKTKQKSGLNRVILEQGWGMFKTFLEYKQLWSGGHVLFVDPKYTSQTCPECHHKNKDNRQTQAEFS